MAVPAPHERRKDAYALDPSAVQDPPKRLFQMVRHWGPGLVLTASVVGSGELIATTGLGAKAGFVALWVILLSCFLKIAIQLMIGRYAIYRGQTTLRFFDELPGPRLGAGWFVWLLLVVLLFVTLNQGAMLGGVGMVLNILLPQLSVKVWACLVALLVMLMLWVGRYRHIERFSIVMVAAFSLATVICVAMLQTTRFRFSSTDILSGLTFDLPEGGLAIAFALMGITGIGTTEIIFYPYWCIEKGYARSVGGYQDTPQWYRRARGWIRVMHWDAFLSMLIYTTLTLAFFVLGAAVLHAQGLVPEGMAMIDTLSRMFTEVLGNWAFLLFLAGAFFALFSTIFVSIAANARLFAECLELAGVIRPRDFYVRENWVKGLVIVIPIVTFLLFLLFELPLWMVVVGGTAQALLLPAIVGGIVYLRFRKFDAKLKPSLTFDILFLISCLAIVLFSIHGVVSQFRKSEALPAEASVSAVPLFEVPSYCEGIVFDRNGMGYVSYGDRVVTFDGQGKHRIWARVRGANGHKVLPDGTHLVCSMTDRAVVHLDAGGAIIKYMATQSEGAPLRAPNDLTLDEHGGVYFTDPRGYGRDLERGSIHYIDSGGTTRTVAVDLAVPNGIACTPDGTRLIVALTGENSIIEFPIFSPGKVGAYRVLADLPPWDGTQARVLPDGLCLDTQGNIYVAHYGTGKVRVLSPDGRLLRSYPAGNLIVSNVAFAGPGMNQLFTTGSISKRPGQGGVFRLDLQDVKGVDLLGEHNESD